MKNTFAKTDKTKGINTDNKRSAFCFQETNIVKEKRLNKEKVMKAPIVKTIADNIVPGILNGIPEVFVFENSFCIRVVNVSYPI